jgi:glycosyltransferase involved in cell wall biosynthesis
MRIAHYIHRYPPALGGSEAYFARLSKYLVSSGHSVHVATTSALDLEAFWSQRAATLEAGSSNVDGVEIKRYRPWRPPGRRFLLKGLSFFPNRTWQALTLPCNPISFRMWTDAGLPGVAFDIVHAAAFPYAWPIVCARRLARRSNVPFVLTPFVHLGDPRNDSDPTRRAYLSPVLLALLHSADLVFVQTELERSALLEHGIPADRLAHVGLGVAADECTGGDREGARRRWGIAGEELVIGHLANNSAEKGTVDLVRAAEILWSKGKKLRLVLAGPEMPNFTSFMRRFPIVPDLLRLGVLSESDKRDFFAGIDVFALPSRSDSFGLVLLEAWANGIPNLAYRAGGIAEVIRDGQDGLLAPCGDIHALAKALDCLIGDSSLRSQLGAVGKERTRTAFRWEDKLQRVEELYKVCIQRKNVGGKSS